MIPLFDSQPAIVDGLLLRGGMFHGLERVGVVGVRRERQRAFAHWAEALDR